MVARANQKNQESPLAIFKLDSGRLVSRATVWWIERSPNGYTYYCIHGKPLKDAQCAKCKLGIMRFERKVEK